MQDHFYYPCAYDIYLTLPEAEACSGISVTKWQHQIERGVVIPAIETDAQLKPAQVMIHINYLPKQAAEQYLRERLLRDRLFSVDFVGYLHRHGGASFLHLLRTIEQTKEAFRLDQIAGRRKVQALRSYCEAARLSLATLYRKESFVMSGELKKLMVPPKGYHSICLCPLS